MQGHCHQIVKATAASVANPSASGGFSDAQIKGTEREQQEFLCVPGSHSPYRLCSLSPLVPLVRQLDTEEVDGSNPFGPTISEFLNS